MKPRTATQTRNAKIQSRKAPFRTWVLSSLTCFKGYQTARVSEPSSTGRAVARVLFLLHRLRDGGKKFLVRFRLTESLQQELFAFDLANRREHLAQKDDLPHHLGREQHLFAAGARRGDVDRGERAPFLELAVEDHFRVAGALELLVDHVVHPRAGVDET